MGTGVPQRGGMKGKEEDVLKKKRERERGHCCLWRAILTFEGWLEDGAESTQINVCGLKCCLELNYAPNCSWPGALLGKVG